MPVDRPVQPNFRERQLLRLEQNSRCLSGAQAISVVLLVGRPLQDRGQQLATLTHWVCHSLSQ